MIESISIKNYMSFRDEFKLSFVASNKEKGKALDSFDPDLWYKSFDDKKILKFLMLVGPNAAGKSNTIAALHYLISLATVKKSAKDKKPTYRPYLFDDDSRNKPTEISIVYYVSEDCYSYSLKVSDQRIEEEELRKIAGRNSARLYYRRYDESTEVMSTTFGSACTMSKPDQRILIGSMLDNSSLLATFDTLNIDCPEIARNVDFFKNKLSVVHRSQQSLADKLKTGDEARDKDIKSLVLTLLKDVNSDIDDYNVEETVIDLMKQFGPEDIDTDALNFLLKKYPGGKIQEKLLRFSHKTSKGSFSLDLEDESSGTKSIIRLMILIYDVVMSHKIAFEDEIERGVNSKSLAFILKMFLTLSKDSQMIIATHDTSLFDMDILRRDAVRIINKVDGVTQLGTVDQAKLHKNMSLRNYMDRVINEELNSKLCDAGAFEYYKEIFEKL